MNHYGMSFVVFPTSWRLGVWKIRQKYMLGFGPFRICLHRVSGRITDFDKSLSQVQEQLEFWVETATQDKTEVGNARRQALSEFLSWLRYYRSI